MCACEEVDSGHLAHVVVDDDERHGFVLVWPVSRSVANPAAADESPMTRKSAGCMRAGRRLANVPRAARSPRIFAEPLAEIVSERVHNPGVVIHREQDGL